MSFHSSASRSDVALSPGVVGNPPALQSCGKDPPKQQQQQTSAIIGKTKTWPPPRGPWGVVHVGNPVDGDNNGNPLMTNSVGQGALLEDNIWTGSRALF